ncbi:hypothetical protein EAD96_01640, partial [Micromonospora sp. BL1]|uniref:hypothetical protein n=1 Tax=Micromonospora sp. BL1 TaxID=2478709 RepID=UPI000EF56158
MRVRDRLTAVVVTLAFVLAGLGSAAAPAVTAPAAAEALAAAARPASAAAPPAEAFAAAPPAAAAAPASGTSAVALRAAYPEISWSELVAGPWHDHGGGLGYADGPDDLA